ncbi:MAG TPA: bacteriorhodopsin [Acetobacteraceae bacterium]
MGELSINHYMIVADLFSLMLAAMGVAAVFFFLQRVELLQRYKMAITLLGMTCMVSSYSYYRLYTSWTDAFHVVNGALVSSGAAFNENGRFVDWLLTVPLLLVAFLSTMDLGSRQVRLRSTVLGVLSAEMILLGYPGQLATTVEARALWWIVAMLPALILIYQLFVGLTPAIKAESLVVRKLFRAARLLIVSSWTIYPAAALLSIFGFADPTTFTAVQVGYAAADAVAKVAFGVVLLRAAAQKSEPVEEMVPLAGTLRVAMS